MTSPPQTFGKYQILGELGRGGFATVYRAYDPTLEREVALKLLAPHLTWDPEFAQRFHLEARVAARLSHPNIITIHEIGDLDGNLFIVMELVQGGSLRAFLEESGPMPPADAVALLKPVASALDYAHSRDLVHRDIKPANILLAPAHNGGMRPVLSDFGLVKALTATSALTSSGAVMGTVEYMAPEQGDSARSHEIGPGTDIYALGVVAYHMLTGQVPFSGSTVQVLMAHASKAPPSPASIRSDLPPGLSEAILKALAKSPAERYPTAEAFVEALSAGLAWPPQSTTRVTPQPAPAPDEQARRPFSAERRIDAAAPASAQIGQTFEVLVQVRFPDSPPLGAADWPGQRKPEAVQQAAETVPLSFPLDPRSGKPGPARLRLALDAPGFRSEGERSRLIDVPPDAFSRRVSFLLTPEQAGWRRINVEVYNLDGVNVGTIPLETEVGAAAAGQGVYIANLYLTINVAGKEKQVVPPSPVWQPSPAPPAPRPQPEPTPKPAPISRRSSLPVTAVVAVLALVLAVGGAGVFISGRLTPAPPAIPATAAAGPATATATLPAALAPRVVEWSVFPTEITQGQSVTIAWEVLDAESITIEPFGAVESQGTRTHTPTTTQTYTLLARTGAQTVERAQQVLVATPAPDAPVVTSFQVQPDAFVRGAQEQIRLSWQVQRADRVRIDGGVGQVALSGQVTLAAPAETTVFTLVAEGAGGQTTAQARVVVSEPACRVVTDGLNLRPGPGTVYEPRITVLRRNTIMTPLAFFAGGFPERGWLQVRADEHEGWVLARSNFVECNVTQASLPPGVAPPTPTATHTLAPTATATPTRTPTPTPTVALGFAIDHFLGNWVNSDPNTQGMTRLVIVQVDDRTLTFHGYGKCTPQDCDWGEIAVPFRPPRPSGRYDFGFAAVTVTVERAGNQLQATVFTDYTPADGRRDRTDIYLMNRQRTIPLDSIHIIQTPIFVVTVAP